MQYKEKYQPLERLGPGGWSRFGEGSSDGDAKVVAKEPTSSMVESTGRMSSHIDASELVGILKG